MASVVNKLTPIERTLLLTEPDDFVILIGIEVGGGYKVEFARVTVLLVVMSKGDPILNSRPVVGGDGWSS